MAAGLARNTPRYNWRKELNGFWMENVIRMRTWRYIVKVYEMEEERWPKVCLREEVRAIVNRRPSKWGKELYDSAREMGMEKIFDEMWKRVPVGNIKALIGEGMKKIEQMCIKQEMKKAEESSYNPWYKDICKNVDGTKYWENQRICGSEKEMWCKLRCAGSSVMEVIIESSYGAELHGPTSSWSYGGLLVTSDIPECILSIVAANSNDVFTNSGIS
ncbi:hypothetical protein PV327_002941 [Microctonus hyperodae]|uniref:Uncharacterized protein n=1 Tax=Microctonus hyperodae TaxID=165561 RepID=A0AA39G4H1_MICHY|nr:hypothetical protein PV327_002941 [Microctonus hyperodae]